MNLHVHLARCAKLDSRNNRTKVVEMSATETLQKLCEAVMRKVDPKHKKEHLVISTKYYKSDICVIEPCDILWPSEDQRQTVFEALKDHELFPCRYRKTDDDVCLYVMWLCPCGTGRVMRSDAGCNSCRLNKEKVQVTCCSWSNRAREPRPEAPQARFQAMHQRCTVTVKRSPAWGQGRVQRILTKRSRTSGPLRFPKSRILISTSILSQVH